MTTPPSDAAKIDALTKVLETHFKGESVLIPVSVFRKNPLLRDEATLERLLARVQEDTGRNVSVTLKQGTVTSQVPSADPSMYPSLQKSVLQGVEVSAANPTVLAKALEKARTSACGEKFTGNLIKTIEIIPREAESKADVVVNGKVLPKAIGMYGKLWAALIETADGGSTKRDDSKTVADYFNKNRRCPLYKHGHDLTQVLADDKGTLSEARGVKITMGKKQTLTRRKRAA